MRERRKERERGGGKENEKREKGRSVYNHNAKAMDIKIYPIYVHVPKYG